MKKLIAVLLALSCMLIGAAAVAETLNVAYMPNYGSLWAVETAINKGYFEEEGLTEPRRVCRRPDHHRGYGKRLHRCGLHRPGRA